MVAICAAMLLSGVGVGAQAQAPPDHEGSRVVWQRAEAALSMGQELEAEALFRQAITLDRRNWQAYLGLGHYYLDRRLNCDDAVPNYEAALELVPRVSSVLRPIYEALQTCYGRERADPRFLAVAETYAAVLRSERQHAEAFGVYRVRARWLIRLERYAEAEQALGDLLLEDWSDAEAHELRAHVRYHQGRFEEARADYAYIRQTFDPPLISLYLGVVLLRLERWAEAVEALTASLHRDGELPETYQWMAQAYIGLGQRQRAEWAYRRALAFVGTDEQQVLTLKNNLAWLLVTGARPVEPSLREALVLSTEVVEATGGVVPAYTDTLAEILLRLGDTEGALRWARVSVRLEPGNRHYSDQLARMEAAAAGFPGAGRRVLRRWREP